MKAALKVPSANSLLKVFGNLNATKNASANTVAPKKNAIKISLRYPRILLISVKKLKIEAEDNRFIKNLN